LSDRHIVLIGDAAHTTHFSQGFGTMFAFDDATALQSALACATDVQRALELYEASQRPKVSTFQAAASRSMRWSESVLSAAERKDRDRLEALIAARWRDNEIPPAPMDESAPRARSQ